MLESFRQTAPAASLLICVALLAAWMTGAHAHRHVGRHPHGPAVQAAGAWDSIREFGHGHQALHAHADVGDLAHAEHSVAEHNVNVHSDAHPITLIHDDGHENVELQALKPSPGKALPDWPWLLLYCAVLVLNRSRTQLVAVLTDPPDPRSATWSLRPPLRGPPSFSVALI